MSYISYQEEGGRYFYPNGYPFLGSSTIIGYGWVGRSTKGPKIGYSLWTAPSKYDFLPIHQYILPSFFPKHIMMNFKSKPTKSPSPSKEIVFLEEIWPWKTALFKTLFGACAKPCPTWDTKSVVSFVWSKLNTRVYTYVVISRQAEYEKEEWSKSIILKSPYIFGLSRLDGWMVLRLKPLSKENP